MWMSFYIVSFGVVTCFVTSPIFVKVRKFKLNFHNRYRSQNVKSYFLQLPLESKYLVGSYSDEQGSCSFFKRATRGLIHKLLQKNLFGNILSARGCPVAFLMDDSHAHGQPSYQGRPLFPKCWGSSKRFPDGRPSCPWTIILLGTTFLC